MKKECPIIVRAALVFLLAGMARGNAASAESLQARIEIKAVDGAAMISENGTDYRPLRAGESAGPGAILKTATNSTVDLFLPDSGTVLRMAGLRASVLATEQGARR